MINTSEIKCKERTLYYYHTPQCRSQRMEPLIPNLLHCVEYCVDAALFWLPTQILICKMLTKSEVEGWPKKKPKHGLSVPRAMEIPLGTHCGS